MRALLLYNPNATTTTPAVTDVIARALSADLKLDVEATKRRDHASFLAAGAAHEGYEVVVALGGDGTVNEVVQGLARTDVRLAIIPGGSTNVWARSLGLPGDPVEATAAVLAALRERRERVVNLGTANGRYFTFHAGYGFDAAVVRDVERRYRLKQTVRQASFLYCGALAWLRGATRRGATITLRVPGAAPLEGLRTVITCNCDPYTYLGRRPARLCPDASLDADLDVVSFSRLSLPTLARIVRAALQGGDVASIGGVRREHDLAALELEATGPVPLQVDGDYVGDTASVRLTSAERALRVVA